jgi:hypothetical protein
MAGRSLLRDHAPTIRKWIRQGKSRSAAGAVSTGSASRTSCLDGTRTCHRTTRSMQRAPKKLLLMINGKDLRTSARHKKIGNLTEKHSDHRGLKRPAVPGPGGTHPFSHRRFRSTLGSERSDLPRVEPPSPQTCGCDRRPPRCSETSDHPDVAIEDVTPYGKVAAVR